ncbi:2-oxo acid dehydrogenase subunit E2 [Natronosporangium hydrolyticum]|uniref:Dihydrolipoamide acetyltransferase component of pyruvate dehydrogenase complex n=1 Tax=Natronosporangium hydrolyticum TaxID=2811111 RepID=A0A895YKV3_9ACTN|nr:dihydrolipoamide acetyltransferase family protein [Natronosporangium hydrolyticum]QSB14730.1 2-oxo acid dehydrogenase subunit E2 [Natronosporangium hydrolyticum]
MSVNEFPLPDLGEGLTEGEILKWLVAEGDTIEQNQPLVEVETAKAAVEIPAKWPGRVVKIYQPEGATVAVGAPIVAIDTGGGDGPAEPAPAASAEPAPATNGEGNGGKIGEVTASGRTAVLVGYGPRTAAAVRRPRKRPEPATGPAASPAAAAAPVAPTTPAAPAVAEPAPAVNGGPALAKPPVRKLARDLGVDLRTLHGSGPAGSITREDVETALAGAPAAAPAPTATTAPVFGPDREQRVPVKGVRKLTAENMTASAFTAPHVTEFLTIDMTRGMRALGRLKEQREWREVRVSPLLLTAKAVLLALRRHPMVNSSWDAGANEIVVKEYVNLGIAAATDRGLIVPNIKDAGRLSLRELAESMTELVQTAKAGRTAPADMSGGTFTITNVGVFGVDTGTPILPPGEAAILAFGAVREQPWAHKGKVKVRQVTTLGLSFDHRIIDGELGSRFLADVGAFLSDPETALLGWG